jgi:hypothetical protein
MGIIRVIGFILFLLFLVFFFFLIKGFYHSPYGDCIEEFARSYCESEGKEYKSHTFLVFSCKESDRELVGKKYWFSEEELRICGEILK